MDIPIYLLAILSVIFTGGIILTYMSKYRVFVRLKSHIHGYTFPNTRIRSRSYIPWKSNESFRLILETETDTVYFDFGSTAEALDKLSNHYIQPNKNLTIPVDGAECPICGEMMNPLSGAEGFRDKPVWGVFRTKEPVNICISCSKGLRRDMVRQGTPTHSTAEIVAGDWSELETDIDFL